MDEPVGRSCDRGCPRAPANQSGFTLLESLVALVLLVIGFFAIAQGLITTQRVSASNNDHVVAIASLTKVTDALKNASYTGCATRSQILAKVPTPMLASDGKPMTVEIVSVAYWRSAQTYGVVTCNAGTDRGTQLVTVRVVVRDGSAQGSVVLRNPSQHP
jgi:prepilin-type N-terminal cleavage/methylation domain-containing protein